MADPVDRGSWFAAASRGAAPAEPEDYTVAGDEIRLKWDYGVEVPLWDGEGHLSDEPEWVQRALGLSDRLMGDLIEWGRAMGRLDHLAEGPDPEREAAYRQPEADARALVARLDLELDGRFRVRYVAW